MGMIDDLGSGGAISLRMMCLYASPVTHGLKIKKPLRIASIVMEITSWEVRKMNEIMTNSELFEKFAKEVMQLETQGQIDSFVNTFIYAMIGLIYSFK